MRDALLCVSLGRAKHQMPRTRASGSSTGRRQACLLATWCLYRSTAALRTPSAASFRAFITGTRLWLVFGRAALHPSARWDAGYAGKNALRAARCATARHT